MKAENELNLKGTRTGQLLGAVNSLKFPRLKNHRSEISLSRISPLSLPPFPSTRFDPLSYRPLLLHVVLGCHDLSLPSVLLSRAVLEKENQVSVFYYYLESSLECFFFSRSRSLLLTVLPQAPGFRSTASLLVASRSPSLVPPLFTLVRLICW